MSIRISHTIGASLRSTSRRTWQLQNRTARRGYATPPDPTKGGSNNIPLAVGGAVLTLAGAYAAFAPAGTASEVTDKAANKAEKASDKAKEKAHDAKDKAKEAKDEAKSKAEVAAERERERDTARGPKPNPNANSEKRHQEHARTNELKERHGKFSDVVFDNHDTSHSTDPAADFEVKKRESKGK